MPVFGLKMRVLVLGGRECFEIIKKSVEKFGKVCMFLRKVGERWGFIWKSRM